MREKNQPTALNPQPLPPHELGAAIATEFVHTAWLADRFGLDPGLAFNDLDDWCPTVPKKPKLPRKLPNLVGWINSEQLIIATFASFALGIVVTLAVVCDPDKLHELVDCAPISTPIALAYPRTAL